MNWKELMKKTRWVADGMSPPIPIGAFRVFNNLAGVSGRWEREALEVKRLGFSKIIERRVIDHMDLMKAILCE